MAIQPREPVNGRKRKRNADQEEQKTNGAAKGSKAANSDALDEILLLQTTILESRKNYNNIAQLLDYARDALKDQQRSIVASVALCGVFTRLSVGGHLTLSKGAAETEATLVRWLQERVDEYVSILLAHLKIRDSTAQSTALTLLMQFARENAKVHHIEQNHRNLLTSIVKNVIEGPVESTVIDEFVTMYAQANDDIRYYTFITVAEKVDQSVSSDELEHAISLLASISPLSHDSECSTLYFESSTGRKKTKLLSRASQMKQAQRAWVSVLAQTLTKGQRKRCLAVVSTTIGPWFTSVELLMDFLKDSFNVGGSTSLAALPGIFYLIQNKNLDYPQFYHNLYSRLDGNILHSKHRSGFFRLLDTCLGSTHLPASLVASFVKRLSRLSLNAPPSGIVVVIPLIYNLMQSHPTCKFMVHRTADVHAEDDMEWGDPFKMNELDPTQTDAIESSLWEIVTLQSHYDPNVATIAKIISQPFTKPVYNLEDFLDRSYATMLGVELSKDMMKTPEVEFQIPKKIFTKYEAEAGKEDSLMVKLWDFP